MASGDDAAEPPPIQLSEHDGPVRGWEPDETPAPRKPLNGNGDARAHAGPPELVDPLVPLPIAEWAAQEPPERKWIVPGLLSKGAVALLTSDGGLGKSLLMMQLQCCASLGAQWLGREIPRVRSIGYYCEDDPEELQRRLRDCVTHYGTTEADIAEEMILYSRAGKQTALISFDPYNNTHGLTKLYDQLMLATEEIGAQVVIIDTAADTFEGNENIRPQVRQYVNQLRRFALATEGGVILLAHPSVTGLSSGSGLSGSTAWHNTVRGRAYIRRPAAACHDDDTDNGVREIEFMKSNYSATGDKIEVKWEAGVFVVARAPEMGIIGKLSLDQDVLGMSAELVGNGTRLSADSRSPTNYIVKILKCDKRMRRYRYPDIQSSVDKLLKDGKLVKVELKFDSKIRVCIRPADKLYPGEPPTPPPSSANPPVSD